MKNLNITMPISMNKKYRTKSGSNVTLLSINAPLNGSFKIVGVADNVIRRWNHLGTSVWDAEFNLVEVSEYEDFKIDDPVMVRDDESEEWTCRHFAGVDSNGLALTWGYGTTSWTIEDELGSLSETVNWLQCRKPTAEEIKAKSK